MGLIDKYNAESPSQLLHIRVYGITLPVQLEYIVVVNYNCYLNYCCFHYGLPSYHNAVPYCPNPHSDLARELHNPKLQCPNPCCLKAPSGSGMAPSVSSATPVILSSASVGPISSSAGPVAPPTRMSLGFQPFRIFILLTDVIASPSNTSSYSSTSYAATSTTTFPTITPWSCASIVNMKPAAH
ncbi:hypothetical protein K469DRAFT_214451 [Zopfia rhizophila CBS 207.26]|uniref:Uncharacterized protein n=1 Tax=Zopfia rhizophila CBS 207.26 TaxID=1314779 RepID=A0A6A6DYW1_9PEZI|nr:hypothetical protein K469DRAFT_214451 [Zopfia rhizophila CBS 207.26]